MNRTVITLPTIHSHSLQIVGTTGPIGDRDSEQWLPECMSCGWIGPACASSVLAQGEIRKHLGVRR